MLDPHINYAGLKAQAMEDQNEESHHNYLEEIDHAKELLRSYFLKYYITNNSTTIPDSSPAKKTPAKTFNFFAFEKRSEVPLSHELDEYLALKPLGFR